MQVFYVRKSNTVYKDEDKMLINCKMMLINHNILWTKAK